MASFVTIPIDGRYAGRSRAQVAALLNAAPDLLAALQFARGLVADELAARIGSHTIDGDMSTLDESDGGCVGEAMDCLAKIDAALAKAGE